MDTLTQKHLIMLLLAAALISGSGPAVYSQTVLPTTELGQDISFGNVIWRIEAFERLGSYLRMHKDYTRSANLYDLSTEKKFAVLAGSLTNNGSRAVKLGREKVILIDVDKKKFEPILDDEKLTYDGVETPLGYISTFHELVIDKNMILKNFKIHPGQKRDFVCLYEIDEKTGQLFLEVSDFGLFSGSERYIKLELSEAEQKEVDAYQAEEKRRATMQKAQAEQKERDEAKRKLALIQERLRLREEMFRSGEPVFAEDFNLPMDKEKQKDWRHINGWWARRNDTMTSLSEDEGAWRLLLLDVKLRDFLYEGRIFREQTGNWAAVGFRNTPAGLLALRHADGVLHLQHWDTTQWRDLAQPVAWADRRVYFRIMAFEKEIAITASTDGKTYYPVFLAIDPNPMAGNFVFLAHPVNPKTGAPDAEAEVVAYDDIVIYQRTDSQ